VVSRVNSAAAVHLCTDRPVLLEVRVVALNGGRVDAFFLPDFVGTAVAGQSAVLGCRSVVRGIVVTH
jgi:hypothetical protein